MRSYLDLDGGSGVTAFAIGKGYIVIEFAAGRSHGGRFYRYAESSCGAGMIVAMQALAEAGRGLATYVAQHDPAYESRWERPRAAA